MVHIPETDPFHDHTVVCYVRTLGPTRYHYVAIRAAGQWYISGIGHVAPLTWEEFANLMFSERTSDIEVATDFLPWDAYVRDYGPSTREDTGQRYVSPTYGDHSSEFRD